MNVLSNLRVSGISTLGLRWSPHKAPFKFEETILKNPGDAHYARVLHGYQGIPSDILRWRVTTNVGIFEKSRAVIRRRVKRRWTAAFQQALKEQGFGNDGKPLGPPGTDTPHSAIRGTLEMYAFGGLNSEFKRLLEQSRAVVYGVRSKVKNG